MKDIALIYLALTSGAAESVKTAIKAKGIKCEAFNSFDELIERISIQAPDHIITAVEILSSQEKPFEKALEYITKLKAISPHTTIQFISKAKPTYNFMKQCDKFGDIVVKFGAEIEIHIPEFTMDESGEEPEEVATETKNSDEADKTEIVEAEDSKEYVEGTITSKIFDGKGMYILSLLPTDIHGKFISEMAMFDNIAINSSPHDEDLRTTSPPDILIMTPEYGGGKLNALMKIPKTFPATKTRIYMLLTKRTNILITGNLGKEGVEFFNSLDELLTAIKGVCSTETRDQNSSINTEEESKQPLEPEKPKENEGQSIFRVIGKGLANRILELRKPKKKAPEISQCQEFKSRDAPIAPQSPVVIKRLILLISPLSCGKTEIATNIAVALAIRGRTVALVDLDLKKKGVFYNFPIMKKDDLVSYKRLFLALNDNVAVEKELLSYAFKARKNLYVYTAHRDVEVEMIPTSFNIFIRELKNAVDVIVVDIDSSIDSEILGKLLDLECSKYIVVTKDISVLNTVPYMLTKFLTCSYWYKDWNIIINRHTPTQNIEDDEVIEYFEGEKTFEIKNIYTVPEVTRAIWDFKAIREPCYGTNTEFDNAINKIIENL